MNRLDEQLRAFDPQIERPMLPESDVSYVVVDSPVGRLVLAATEFGLVRCSYDDESAVTGQLARAISPRVLRSPRRFDDVRRELDRYFAGELRAFTIRVDLRVATPFARKVLQSLERVPYGTTTTYNAIARSISRPGASRAVGNALGANPLCIVYPCHRVVRGDGQIGGYAGGVPVKKLLLDLERT